MNVYKGLSLVVAVGLLGAACGDDDGGGGTLDSGTIDSGIKNDAGSDGGGDAGAMYPCNSGTPPANGMCGGSHCLQTEAQLKASAMPNATCGGDLEIASFCSLEAVNAVTDCVLMSLSVMDDATFTAMVTSCASAKLPGFSAPCLSCFVASGKCAADMCLNECALDSHSTGCDNCRIEKGCISSFYTCSGIANPIDAWESMQ